MWVGGGGEYVVLGVTLRRMARSKPAKQTLESNKERKQNKWEKREERL
jgi:hypothetical protein